MIVNSLEEELKEEIIYLKQKLLLANKKISSQKLIIYGLLKDIQREKKKWQRET